LCTKYQIVELANALLVIVIERISVIAAVIMRTKMWPQQWKVL